MELLREPLSPWRSLRNLAGLAWREVEGEEEEEGKEKMEEEEERKKERFHCTFYRFC